MFDSLIFMLDSLIDVAARLLMLTGVIASVIALFRVIFRSGGRG